MNFIDWTGFVGVAILLIAYFLHLRNILAKESLAYLLLNLVGAAIACFASILLKYMPFVILEGCWTLVSLAGLLQLLLSKKKSPTSSTGVRP